MKGDPKSIGERSSIAGDTKSMWGVKVNVGVAAGSDAFVIVSKFGFGKQCSLDFGVSILREPLRGVV